MTVEKQDWEFQQEGALLLLAHYIDPESAKQSPDNLSSCICGDWSEGEMEPGWDDHLMEVLWDAGWRPTAPRPAQPRPVAHRRRSFRDTAAAQVLTIAGLVLLAVGIAASAAWLMTGGVR